ncbi:hypothetical protein TKWG_09285 [Advenella kashmirensis WT001]|uniref:Uncharacterized protein n=1 Tax=Advenella kashmirensis (strain DSM 17095 / LMG 22695 / WT001) TaxID=1036672 RepID=I3UAZ5_ADVKW|nr:hypothetical protein TKWG_09285 [Advenella kashmirensis WT001]
MPQFITVGFISAAVRRKHGLTCFMWRNPVRSTFILRHEKQSSIGSRYGDVAVAVSNAELEGKRG